MNDEDEEPRIDFSPLDPTRDQGAWRERVQRVTRAAISERAASPKRAFVSQLDAWRIRASAVAVSLAAAAWAIVSMSVHDARSPSPSAGLDDALLSDSLRARAPNVALALTTTRRSAP